jgi:retron-type reverse transcriptase
VNENEGALTAGPDGKTGSADYVELEKIARKTKIDGRTGGIRRAWIPKEGRKDENGNPVMRPLGIPNFEDRVKQKLALLALEPE